MKKGICFGVSVGPGQEGLITRDAIEIIDQADYVFLPSAPKEECKAYIVAKKSIPNLDDKNIICEVFTMSKDKNVMENRHDEIASKVKDVLDAGKSIAFLTLGEVGLYSTYIYIHDRLVAAGYTSILVPGISSPQAICDKLSVPMAIGNEEIHIFPDTRDLQERLAIPGTKIFMKPKESMENLVNIISNYCQNSPNVSVYGISNCGMDGEIIARGVTELHKLSGYFTVIIVKDNHLEQIEGQDDNYKASFDYYENHDCKYYPCHESDHINCMFCYCPLYGLKKCPGKPEFVEKEDGRLIKSCIKCTFPHDRDNYGKIMKICSELVV